MSRSTTFALPNLLTYARILAIPLVCWLILEGSTTTRVVALVLYAAAAFTDWLDGYLARAMKLSSNLGRMLDPIADKLLVGAVIVVLAADGSLSGWDLVPAIAITVREIFVSGLREFVGNAGIVLHVTGLAKWKTTVQLVAILAVLLEPVAAVPTLVADVLLWLAGILTVITGTQYFLAALPHLTADQK